MEGITANLIEIFKDKYPHVAAPVISSAYVTCRICRRPSFYQVAFDLRDKEWFYRFQSFTSQRGKYINVYLCRCLSCDYCASTIPRTQIFSNE